MDFVHDYVALGKKLRILTIVETHSRYCPATDVRLTSRGEDVVPTLDRVCAQIGYPRTIRIDNGSKFILRDLDLWACANEVILDASRPAEAPRCRWYAVGSPATPDHGELLLTERYKVLADTASEGSDLLC